MSFESVVVYVEEAQQAMREPVLLDAPINWVAFDNKIPRSLLLTALKWTVAWRVSYRRHR
jgi:hypothetical protein